ncbi:MAG: hypothetical protein ACW987_17120 [Candidatus Thorarchaeota archaeon]
MTKKLNILSIFFVALFLSSSLFVSVGMMSIPQLTLNLEEHGASTAAYPAVDLDKRNSPVSILVYNEFADTVTPQPNNEFRNTMNAIDEVYGGQYRYDNLTSYTQIASKLPNYDVFLIPEQENVYHENYTDIADAWTGPLNDFVVRGGIVITLDCNGQTAPSFDGPTMRILNATGLMSVFTPADGVGWTNTLVNTSSALARGTEGSWPAPDGSVNFNTTDAEVIVEHPSGNAVVAHKIIGTGHVVLIGHDFFNRDANSDALLANAIRLHRHVVFDDSHAQEFEITAEYSGLANYFASNGFAVSTMSDFSEDYLAACDILVLSLGYVPYNTGDIAIIESFVENGGGLFVCSDWGTWGSETDDLIQNFGYVRYDPGMALNDTDDAIIPFYLPFDGENIHNHSINLKVNRVEIWAGAGFNQIPDDADVLIKTDGDGTADVDNLPIAIASTHGDGRIVVFGDSNALKNDDSDSDGTDNWEDSSNELFFLNTIRWLSASGIEERVIVFDESHSPNFTLGLSFEELAHFLTENGYTIKWMSEFLPGMLDIADVLFIVDGNINYTAGELAQISSFVSDGGSLYATGAYGSALLEAALIAQEFGFGASSVEYLNDTDDTVGPVGYIHYEGTNIENHPITQGISDLEFYLTGTIETPGGSFTPVITTDDDGTSDYLNGDPADGLTIAATTLFNKGRVFFSAEYVSMTGLSDHDSDGTISLYDADNCLFYLNAFEWLTEDRAPMVEVLFPNGGEVLNGTETVTWTAVDFDNDPMVFDVYLSDNNGSGWFALELGLTLFEYELNTSLYTDGNSYMVRIVTSANGVTGEDQSDTPFEIDNLPDPTIPPPEDLTLWVLLAIGGVLVLVIVFVLMKRKK